MHVFCLVVIDCIALRLGSTEPSKPEAFSLQRTSPTKKTAYHPQMSRGNWRVVT